MGWSTHHPNGLIYYAPQHSYRGYTLITSPRGTDAYLLDMDGRVCHRWHLEEGISYGYLLHNGHLLMRTNPPAVTDGRPRGARTAVGAVMELDWGGNLVWAYRNAMVHHDFQRLANGNTLVLVFEEIPPDVATQVKGGIVEEYVDEPMLGDVVHEVTPAGETVDSWCFWERLNFDEDVICFLGNRYEWTHQNSLNVTSRAGQLSPNQRRGHRGPGQWRIHLEMGTGRDLPPA